MADKKISELTALTTPDGTEELIVNDSGVSKKITQSNLLKGIDNTAADATAITIDASENVGIGVTPETWHNSYQALQVGGRAALAYDGQTTLTHNVYASTATGAPQYYIDSSVQPSRVRLTNTGTIDFSVAPSGTADTAITWTTPLTIANAGDVTVGTGNLVIGTSGKGIDFSADGNAAGMTSEVLDDYETGTWTPGAYLNFSIDSVTDTRYVKVGNLVTAYIFFNITTTSTSIQVSGLPYTSAGHGPVLVYYGSDVVTAYIESNTNRAYINLGSNLTNSGIMFSATYRAA